MGVRNYPDLPRVYLDMDGPMADFDKYCEDNDIAPEIAKTLSGTYLYLSETEGTREAISHIKKLGYDIFILSKIPSENAGAATEKHFWLHQHYPELEKKLILSPDKGCVGTKRDILIDDHPEWANAHNFPGTVIKFATMSNSGGQSWNQIKEALLVKMYGYQTTKHIEP